MEETFETFKQKVWKSKKERKDFKISNSVGVYDMYKLARKNGWYDIGKAVSEKDFYAIIRGINNKLAEEIALGNTVTFPSRMGRLELRKHSCGVSFEGGKLKITYPIDWSSTLKLWYEDAEAHKEKTLVRNEEPYVFYVKYVKRNATYNNQIFYKFELNNFIRKHLKENIKKGKIDTLW